jgi:hypothetical protein
VKDAAFDRAATRVHAALNALLAVMQDVERRDPRFMARMRQYGILPRLTDLTNAQGELSGQVARIFREHGIE